MDQVAVEGDEIKLVELALEEASRGKHSRYQYRITFLTGLLYAADSMEVSLLSFLYECVGASFNLTSGQAATIVAIVFVGELIGSVIAWPAAEYLGRRPASLLSAVMVALFGLLTTLAYSFLAFLICRFMVGLGVGMFAIPFDLAAEFLPKDRRGSKLTLLLFWWAVGTTYASSASWLVSILGYSWRLLCLVCALPFVFVTVLMFLLLDESPLWLASRGHLQAARALIAKVHRINASSSSQESIDIDQSRLLTEAADEHTEEHSAELDEEEDTSACCGRQLVSLDIHTQKKTMTFQYLTCVLATEWFLTGVLFYGVSLLTSRLFDDSSKSSMKCNFNYAFILGVSTSEFFGVFFAYHTVDSYGRVRVQTICYGLAAIALALVAAGARGSFSFVLLYITLGSSLTATTASWIHIAELYDTSQRMHGHAICLASSRLGAFLASYLVDSKLSIFVVASTLALSALLPAIMIPSTLPETVGLLLR